MVMVLQLASEEPEGGPWRAELLTVVVEALLRLGDGRAAGGRGVVLAVDGRSSSGKTTLAARLQDAIANSAMVHTDDIAWWHSRFGWTDLLMDGVLVPFRRGEPVSFRPPRWAEHDRRGSIEVPAGASARHRGRGCRAFRGVARLVDALVSVLPTGGKPRASEPGARRAGWRGRSRRDHLESVAEEDPFLAVAAALETADMLVAIPIPFDRAAELVVAPPARPV